MNFIPGTCLNHPKDSAVYWFLFHDHQVLMDISPDTSSVSNAGSVSDTSGIPGNPSEVGYHLPLAVGEIFALTSTERYLGTLEGHPCYFATVAANQDFPATYSFIRVRDLYGKMPKIYFGLWAGPFTFPIGIGILYIAAVAALPPNLPPKKGLKFARVVGSLFSPGFLRRLLWRSPRATKFC